MQPGARQPGVLRQHHAGADGVFRRGRWPDRNAGAGDAGPGEWIQVSSPLAAAGFDNGFIAVERIAGTGRFFAYGVVNDNVTNDGALIPPVQDGTPPEDQILPVIVESGNFESDLVLTNPASQPVTATLSYVESLAPPASGVPFRTDIALGGFEQRLIPSAIDFLRERGLASGPRGGESHAGAVGVRFSRDGIPAPGYAGVLTATPAPQGGRYGLSTTAFLFHARRPVCTGYGLQHGHIPARIWQSPRPATPVSP